MAAEQRHAVKAGPKNQKLARNVSPPLLILLALGTTLGAGIYVVIGEIIGIAGYLSPLSFVGACVVAGLTGASFAELSGRLPSSGGPVAWADAAFGRRTLSIAVGWGIVATGIVSGATVATGFVSYAATFVDWSKWWVLPALIGLPTAVAVVGVRESAWFMALTALAGIVGLLIVLFLAGPNLLELPTHVAEAVSAAAPLAALWPVLIGAFLAFYAFIGFEDIAHLGDEAQRAEKAVPLAIFVTLAVSLLLYVAICAVAIATLPPHQLAASKAPLVDVAVAAGGSGLLVAVFGMITIADGLFAQIIMVTRTMYDLGERRGGAPAVLARIWPRTRTPAIATLLVGGVILTLALFFPTRTLAEVTSAIVLVVFAGSNIALIVLKRREPAGPGRFRVPGFVPWAGAASCLLLLCVQPFLEG